MKDYIKGWIQSARVALAAFALGPEPDNYIMLGHYLKWVRDGRPELRQWVIENVPAEGKQLGKE